MTPSELIEKEIEKIKSMTIELRNDLFYNQLPNKENSNELLDRFNAILWEINAPLTNLVNSFKNKIDN